MDLKAGLEGCGKFHLHRDSIPDRPARRKSLYRLSYRAPPVPVETVFVIGLHSGYICKSNCCECATSRKASGSIRVSVTGIFH